MTRQNMREAMKNKTIYDVFVPVLDKDVTQERGAGAGQRWGSAGGGAWANDRGQIEVELSFLHY